MTIRKKHIIKKDNKQIINGKIKKRKDKKWGNSIANGYKKDKKDIYNKIKKYCSGKIRFNYAEESDFLSDPELQSFTGVNLSKNSGKISEWYVGRLLKEHGIKYIQQPIIRYGKHNRYLQPDFYVPSKDLFIEVKSRTYNCGGTCSEKIDHVARKYSTRLNMTKNYKNSKVLIVFCAGELFEESTLQLINYRSPQTSKYIKGFVEFTKNHHVLDWIDINNINKFL